MHNPWPLELSSQALRAWQHTKPETEDFDVVVAVAVQPVVGEPLEVDRLASQERVSVGLAHRVAGYEFQC